MQTATTSSSTNKNNNNKKTRLRGNWLVGNLIAILKFYDWSSHTIAAGDFMICKLQAQINQLRNKISSNKKAQLE